MRPGGIFSISSKKKTERAHSVRFPCTQLFNSSCETMMANSVQAADQMLQTMRTEILLHRIPFYHQSHYSVQPSLTYPVLLDPVSQGEMQRGNKLVDIWTAHCWTIQMISQHGADQRLSCSGGAIEGQHQGPVRGFILKKLCHLLWHNFLGQMLAINIFVEVPFQVFSENTDNR